ncbi:hypothetical protein BDV30DRAFT_212301 [Aspergillus minisclerotigenes]|uniref:Uncharacterized protein n=1 Tax=Aspergillus minisclerotigenes TaxID=656917 RepID=A0A5N6J1X5_9EURO|nr:hypothetical protein BDV30DRAFT_212301 [Aspergillus minisclerotigenes]
MCWLTVVHWWLCYYAFLVRYCRLSLFPNFCINCRASGLRDTYVLLQLVTLDKIRMELVAHQLDRTEY